MNITGINGQYKLKTERISVTVKGYQSPVFTIQPFVHPKIQLGNVKYDYERLKHKFDHLSVLANIKFNLSEVAMIIGQDAYDLQCPLDYRKRKKNELTAVMT